MKKNKFEKTILIALQGCGMSFLGTCIACYITDGDLPLFIIAIISVYLAVVGWFLRKLLEVYDD